MLTVVIRSQRCGAAAIGMYDDTDDAHRFEFRMKARVSGIMEGRQVLFSVTI